MVTHCISISCDCFLQSGPDWQDCFISQWTTVHRGSSTKQMPFYFHREWKPGVHVAQGYRGARPPTYNMTWWMLWASGQTCSGNKVSLMCSQDVELFDLVKFNDWIVVCQCFVTRERIHVMPLMCPSQIMKIIIIWWSSGSSHTHIHT